MLFNSLTFLYFFVAYLIAVLLMPARFRLWVLVIGSALFYGYWNWHYIALPFLLTLITYMVTAWAMAVPFERRRRRIMYGVILILLPLAFFKYAKFFYNEIFIPVAGFSGYAVAETTFELKLPLAISFISFTLIAYLVDVTNKKFEFHRSPRWLLSYVLFFPHLLAGPIVRPHELIPQIQRQRPLRWRRFLPGLALCALGLMKKMLIADPLGDVIGPIYENPAMHSALECLLAFYGFPVQIYCDFSGYTDMAIGLAFILGVRLPTNFAQPFCARDLVDYRRRWHITLVTWMRDYIYIPLGGNRVSRLRTIFNLIFTMSLGGLWHGAAWTFILWGALNGVGVSIGHLKRDYIRFRLPKWIAIVITFHIAAFLMVFFRAADLVVAAQIFSAWVGALPLGDIYLFLNQQMFMLFLMLIFFATHRWDNHSLLHAIVRKSNPFVVLTVIITIIILSIAFGTSSSGKFIYFEF